MVKTTAMEITTEFRHFIQGIPKAELHVHIEGTIKPKFLYKLAKNNHVKLPYANLQEIKKAYQINDLQHFIDVYYRASSVLLEEQDYYKLTLAYLKKLHAQNVLHAEIMFEPQTHIHAGVSFETVITGISKAMSLAQNKWGITSKLILSILLHFSLDDAIETLQKAAPFRKCFFAVGLNSSRLDYPPRRFMKLVDVLHKSGFIIMSHVGQSEPSANVQEAIELFHSSRIDYGKRTLVNSDLMSKIVDQQIPLTLCPLSNFTLSGRSKLKDYPLKEMMKLGMLVAINSEYPAFSRAHLNDTYIQLAKDLKLQKEDIVQLAINSFKASFLSESEKQVHIASINSYANA